MSARGRIDAADGRDGGNSRNGTRAKTVLTEIGPVPLEVPRDREGSFEPQLVKKRQRRLHGVDEMVLSLGAKGLTTGEVQAHLAEVYGADVSRENRLQDHRPGARADGRVADPAAGAGGCGGIHRRVVVTVRDGQVTNRPVYTARLHRHRRGR